MTDFLKTDAEHEGQEPQVETVTMRRTLLLLSGLFVFCVLISAVCEALGAHFAIHMDTTLGITSNAATALFASILTAAGLERYATKRS